MKLWSSLSISPAFSGKGYGKDFVHFYEDYALAHGCNLLRIDTNVINTPAISLYKSLGYIDVGTLSCTYNDLENIEIILGWCTNIFPTFYIVSNRAVNQESIFKIIDITFYRRLADCRMFYAFRSCTSSNST